MRVPEGISLPCVEVTIIQGYSQAWGAPRRLCIMGLYEPLTLASMLLCYLRLHSTTMPILDGESFNLIMILGEKVDMFLSTMHRNGLLLASLCTKIV